MAEGERETTSGSRVKRVQCKCECELSIGKSSLTSGSPVYLAKEFDDEFQKKTK